MRKLALAVIVAFSLGTSGCSLINKIPSNPTVAGIIDCGKDEVKSLIGKILGKVSTILAVGGDSYEDQLKQLVKDSSAEALACAVKQVTVEFEGNVSASAESPNASNGAKNGEKFMADMNYQFKN